jgi:hypothetical protein
MKMIASFDSMVYLILYGVAGGLDPAREADIFLKLRPGVLIEVG